ncbi:hypothetical protein BO86DRAFT_83731 [Aspergillus japonicus CBS 114.51]|uniref:Uncharacterized protein n=1 Tax=Aspergillus japonicus CBS 114.51 TaxID=1448312 RepID=A0A8T8X1Y9_ASPJA|nr:hypothetical protein BO86DRAFT_83731 [Aspergillus japonicus CBS 114.51]RAH82167.1 hypothetical protein BO86DRAFT_83731 [Aspergillus japonicus CBS 114.51]
MSVENLEMVARLVLRCLRADPRRWNSNLIIIGHLAIGRQLPGFETRLDPLLRRMQEHDVSPDTPSQPSFVHGHASLPPSQRYAVEFLLEDRGDGINNTLQDVQSTLRAQLARLRPTEFRLVGDRLWYQHTEIKLHVVSRPQPNFPTDHYLHRPLLNQVIGEMRRALAIQMHRPLSYASVETALTIMIARCTKRRLLAGETSHAIAKDVEALLSAIAITNARQGVRGRGEDRLRWTVYHTRALYPCLSELQNLLSWRGPEGRKELKSRLNND